MRGFCLLLCGSGRCHHEETRPHSACELALSLGIGRDSLAALATTGPAHHPNARMPHALAKPEKPPIGACRNRGRARHQGRHCPDGRREHGHRQGSQPGRRRGLPAHQAIGTGTQLRASGTGLSQGVGAARGSVATTCRLGRKARSFSGEWLGNKSSCR